MHSFIYSLETAAEEHWYGKEEHQEEAVANEDWHAEDEQHDEAAEEEWDNIPVAYEERRGLKPVSSKVVPGGALAPQSLEM